MVLAIGSDEGPFRLFLRQFWSDKRTPECLTAGVLTFSIPCSMNIAGLAPRLSTWIIVCINPYLLFV